MIISRFTTSLLILGLLTSCSGLEMLPMPAPASIPTETPLPSPTIAWFPPSAAPTPQVFATYPATPEMRPGLGEMSVTDDFSEPDLWDIATSDQGSAAIKNNQLTLAVQPELYLISLRHGLMLDSFYAEVKASPSLCRGADSYGLLVRGNAVAYYRFALSCNGRVGAERISVGTHQVFQTPILSGDAPSGAPGEVRIGVWAVGNEMRLFLNGRYQFSIVDSNYPVGTVGVFAHSTGNTAVIVSFSDLEVQEVTYDPATRTPNP